jgi:hypothetical protein
VNRESEPRAEEEAGHRRQECRVDSVVGASVANRQRRNYQTEYKKAEQSAIKAADLTDCAKKGMLVQRHESLLTFE